MKENMGNRDRFLRFFLVAIAYILVNVGVITGTLKIAVGLIGIVLILTVLIGICPLYSLFGINTRSGSKLR